ncbi:DUF1501 domain-containing protein [Roseateles sp. PN1]|uniref:DUF1501 domain-containing protein n=1 Tax=Roseateles sp. PN1 TaxID=3137372 RepID=UPI003138BAA8
MNDQTPTPSPRRRFLQASALAAGWTLAGLPQAWAGAAAGSPLSQRKLVLIMLRGAVDGLSVVAPVGDRNYAPARPDLALAPPGSAEGAALKLDSLFALHPALLSLKPAWDQGSLAFVHASGSPDPTRSHFDAQDYLESGTPGLKSTPSGWMNRLLGQLPGPASPTRGVAMGATPPRIFAGPAAVASLGLGPKALAGKAIDQADLQQGLERLYAGDAKLGASFQAALAGRGQMQRSMAGEREPAMNASGDAGAPSARSFAADARRLGQLIRKDGQTQLAFTSVGGWDTHINQGAAQGQLANRLKALGEGLQALSQGLGPALQDTVIVVMSEFGRTVHQNGTLGSDHGRGNVIWLLGGPVAGGRMLGEWPGLESSALVDGRDLAVAVDFRQVLRPILQSHLGLSEAALAEVFPAAPGRWRGEAQVLRS